MIPPASYKKSSFGPAFFFLNKRRRQALAHYYEFCRLADDIADEPNVLLPPEQALQELCQEIEYVYIGVPQTELGHQLLQDVRDFNLAKDRFLLLLEGMQADLQQKKYTPTDPAHPFAALDWYIYRVAVIVGKATLDILGVQGDKADELAQTLGTAVQLTNIVRDIYEDAQLDRVYVPCSLTPKEILSVQHIGIRMEANLNQEAQAGNSLAIRALTLKKTLQLCTQRAYENYTRAFQLMDEFWPTTILPCRVMGYVYQKNLAKIEKTGFTFTRAIKLTKFEKIQAVCYALLKTLF